MPITYAPGAYVNRPRPDFSQYADDPDVAIIPLTQGVTTIIDRADLPLVAGYTWYAHWEKDIRQFRPITNMNKDSAHSSIYMHTLISEFPETDHVNGDTLDNRRDNLREASCSENNRNRSLRLDNSSGFQGVVWDKNRDKWQARIKVDCRQRHLGMFTDIIDAALAYDMAAREHHKEFAALNYPIAGERSAITGELRPMIDG